jgi:diguanylate cyclase (GGDEF)-like protein/PAS domain S-box-containing protein
MDPDPPEPGAAPPMHPPPDARTAPDVQAHAARMEEAMRVAGIGCWELDIVASRLYWSPQIYEIFEIDPTRFAASYQTFLELVHPDDRAAVDAAYIASVRDRSPYAIAHRLLMPDGRVKHVQERGETFYDAAGRPLRSLGTVQDVTARVSAEQALRESEERFRRLVQRGWDAILLLDAQGQLRYASDAIERLVGYRPADLVGLGAAQLVHPEDLDVARTELRLLVEQPGRPRIAEYRVRHRDGGVRYLEVAATNLLDEPSVRAIVLNCRDVTERRAAEQRIRVMEYAIGSSLNAMAMGEDSGRICYVNDAFVRLWGYRSPGQVLGRPMREFWDDPAAAVEVGRRLLHDGSWEGELVARRGDGSRFDAQVSASLVHDGHGSILCMMGSFVDVTERNRTAQRLRQAASVFASTEEGVVITDPRGVILDVNAAFTEITGYSRAEAIGRTPRLLRSDRHDAAFYATFWAALKGEGGWRGEIWNRRKNGEVYPEWLTANAVRDADGALINYVAVFSDISGLMRSQAKLAHLAHHDALTDLPNRLLFLDRLSHAISRAERDGSQLAVLFVDLDGFKSVNDALGHLAGDRLLQEVAARLSGAIRRDDTVARLGGDEFVVLIERLHAPDDACALAGKLLDALAEPVALDGRELRVTGSIGISVYPRDGSVAEKLVQRADAAMYQAKAAGRNAWCCHVPGRADASSPDHDRAAAA